MKHFRCGFSLALGFSLIAFCPAVASAQQTETDTGQIKQPVAGRPVAEARRKAIAAAPFHRPLDEDRIRKWMQLSSACTIAEFELFLDPLTPQEQKLVQKVERLTPPIVNRLPLEHLRSVLTNRGIIALELEEEARRTPVAHTTPAVENDLFGAFDCVFASVGPPDGSPRYGDVIIRLKDSVREHGWATPFSGMHFLSAVRGKDASAMLKRIQRDGTLPTARTNPLSLGFDDRLHYSHYIVTEQHWNKALAYQAVLVLRNLDDSPAAQIVRQRMQAMLAEQNAETFWRLFIPPRKEGLSADEAAARVPFGYLEAKFPDRVTIDEFTSIEIPPGKLKEVRSWPEAAPFLPLIRAKPDGVE